MTVCEQSVTYQGGMHNLTREGLGTLYYYDGRVLKGVWTQGRPGGEMTDWSACGTKVQKGTMDENGKWSGALESWNERPAPPKPALSADAAYQISFHDGSVVDYQGGWKNGQREGLGITDDRAERELVWLSLIHI